MKPPVSALLSRPALRYGVASVAAFGIDLALTMALRLGIGFSLTLSAAIAFVVTGLIFYFVHEFWTFGHDSSTVSAGRLVRNFTSMAIAFCVRVGLIGALELLRTPGVLLALAYFGIGAAASLTVNFLINRYWVFTRT
ncbi:MAG: GtrA family protein [Hyphomonas sp.]|nr:GtrA family protein [Hyphomonas sp.]